MSAEGDLNFGGYLQIQNIWPWKVVGKCSRGVKVLSFHGITVEFPPSSTAFMPNMLDIKDKGS